MSWLDVIIYRAGQAVDHGEAETPEAAIACARCLMTDLVRESKVDPRALRASFFSADGRLVRSNVTRDEL